jgi:hypothetical protein
MARKISDTTLQLLAKKRGLEPINIIRIQWVPGGPSIAYADKDIPGAQGRILTLANLESVLNIDKNSSSISINVKLSDEDGELKEIFNNTDIHGRPAVVYQWFDGIPIEEAFVIFEGGIASPIQWNEGDRTLSFDILSKLEDREVGFSVEEGDFKDLPAGLVGKAWPLVFGTVLNSATLMIDEIPTGTTMVPVGIPDPGIGQQLLYLRNNAGEQLARAACLSFAGADLMFRGDLGGEGRDIFEQGQAYQRQAQALIRQVAAAQSRDILRLSEIKTTQSQYDTRAIRILNGHLFHQGITVELDIGGAHYVGSFNNDLFTVKNRRGPDETVHREPGQDAPAGGSEIIVQDMQANWDKAYADFIFGDFVEAPSDEQKKRDPCGPQNLIIPKSADGPVTPAREGKPFFANAGTSVNIAGQYPVRYILTIIPNTTVVSLGARRTVGGVKKIDTLPEDYYVITEEDFGGIKGLIVTLQQPLSSIKGSDWEDELFATLRSSIGPNIVDILIYLIQTYTSFGIDVTSFNYVKEKIKGFPANFALYDRKNIVDLLKDICFQARLSIWISNDIFYLKYLPESSPPIERITETDINQTTMVINTTETEDLVTKFVINYKPDLSQPDPYKMILRFNIAKYGIHERSFDWYIFNNADAILICATFWLIRMANTWKRLNCKVPLTKLKLETLDTVSLEFAKNYIANVAVNGIVQKATVNTDDWSIDMDIWTPVRLGEMTPYPFAYPEGVDQQLIFPTQKDIAGSFPSDTPTAAIGGILSAFGGTVSFQAGSSDRGASKPQATKADPKAGGSVEVRVAQTNLGKDIKPVKPTTTDYKFPAYTPQNPNPVATPGTGGGIPAQIVGKVGPDSDIENGFIYSCNVYEKGLGDAATKRDVTQLQINKDEEIPEGTWVLASKSKKKSGSGKEQKTDDKWVMQHPIWV